MLNLNEVIKKSATDIISYIENGHILTEERYIEILDNEASRIADGDDTCFDIVKNYNDGETITDSDVGYSICYVTHRIAYDIVREKLIKYVEFEIKLKYNKEPEILLGTFTNCNECHKIICTEIMEYENLGDYCFCEDCYNNLNNSLKVLLNNNYTIDEYKIISEKNDNTTILILDDITVKIVVVNAKENGKCEIVEKKTFEIENKDSFADICKIVENIEILFNE